MSRDYLFVLKALKEIPFNVGKKLLTEFLLGKDTNESIKRNKLDKLENFGSLAYEKEEITAIIDSLILNGLINQTSVNGKSFWKVLELSAKGRQEIDNPSLYKKKLSYGFKEHKTLITQQDRELFKSFPELAKYNESQKKGITSSNKHILCIAGAGSGKTTVLTKRIEFLVKYRSVPEEKILAITFTRKARQEMMRRLIVYQVKVETFNSFCEKILRNNNDAIYGRPVRVISYRDKIFLMNKALSENNISMGKAISIYFSSSQKRGKTDEQLANIFMNDCFFIRDYFKFKNKEIVESNFDILYEHKKSVELVISLCNYIESYMKKHGLRDFADQLIDTLQFFEKNPKLIPSFSHILVDEYQDVNSTQIKLIDLLNPENLFCVGDPRQSIYGWRGSDIRHILDFENKYSNSEIITLTKNYRSTKHIVNLVNKAIKSMKMPDLDSSLEGKKDIRLLKFDNESAEFEFVLQRIIKSDLPRSDIFVLARTNRQLNELSQIMKSRGMKHVVRSDEMKRSVTSTENDITLATIHAIKGLEATMVFVIGCKSIYFPCMGSEHPVIEMVKVEEYDKEEEERRLLYVAMSRAKENLYLTYSNKISNFITNDMLEFIEDGQSKDKVPIIKYSFDQQQTTKVPKQNYSAGTVTRLREWRADLSKSMNIPAYIIMHDKTMIDIAAKMPLTEDELSQIHGLGPVKIMKYGEDILRIVSGQ
ncbi:MAG: UvrD-helicase domain-containing protein [Nanoarchaeota archaeon]